ncbi:hypothetical protein [Ralstonia mannitolilytica]|uniref:hypothetical protein n=1 Tax=Ralstonia mannitolilytica TaxID=105219 RepID=UPI001C955788|nr:hypothetical protein [Ralstonia mannitolilytica]MBY4717571.1 hypothetical protein [Ralstonia mannitolilytica]
MTAKKSEGSSEDDFEGDVGFHLHKKEKTHLGLFFSVYHSFIGNLLFTKKIDQ